MNHVNFANIRSDIVNGVLTLYVSPEGSDTASDAGSIDKPFKTIGKTAEVYNGLVGVSDGTIQLMDGNHPLTANVEFKGNAIKLIGNPVDKSKVNITGGGYKIILYGTGIKAQYFTRTITTPPSVFSAGIEIHGVGDISYITIDCQNIGAGMYGIRCAKGSIGVVGCVINNTTSAVVSSGHIVAMNNSGSNNLGAALYAMGGFITATGNTIGATVNIIEERGGRVFE